jgi:hypothetical protein
MKICFGNCRHCLKRAECTYYQFHKAEMDEHKSSYEQMVRDPQKYQGKKY